jgi:EAL domain-containing protein (putative c-di-GMP-specific phosphodiesterase class I)/GGDEF domain-containing protein
VSAEARLREVIERRSLDTVFQPIFAFREARILGFEALVRGPTGSPIEAPYQLFGAAQREGLVVELNIVCIQETLRAFARRRLPGTLFLNISPQLIVQPGFDQARATRFLDGLGLRPERVVIELTEDYPTFDFALVQESLMLYRSMGFRVAIDDLGEGFSSLRLWSELKPEFVKADKHFVTGIAADALKLQFLRAIQQIAEGSGALVIAEGIETGEDFRHVRDLGIALGQGFFIGRPETAPADAVAEPVAAVHGDARLRVAPVPRLRASSSHARDFVRAIEPAAPDASPASLHARFDACATLAAIPVVGPGGFEGVVSRATLALDPAPIRVDADFELPALAAMLVEADSRRLADGFVILARGRYLGMGRSQDVIRSLHGAQLLAARHTHPLSLLPGPVPIHEHLERLLRRSIPFSVWIADLEGLGGLNDAEGFAKGDALIHATARLLETSLDPEIDFVGHIAGTHFVVMAQSDDWRERAAGAIARFPRLLEAHVAAESLSRGYFCAASRAGTRIRALPRLVMGILPVLPGVYDSRHEALAHAKAARDAAAREGASALHVDERRGNAYPASYLLGSPGA